MSLQMYRCMLEGLRSKLVLGNAERMQGKTGHNMHCMTNTGMNELPIVGVIRRKLSLLCMEYTVTKPRLWNAICLCPSPYYH